MLALRVITSIILLSILSFILLFESRTIFLCFLLLFFFIACLECFKLFNSTQPEFLSITLTIILFFVLSNTQYWSNLIYICTFLWFLKIAIILKFRDFFQNKRQKLILIFFYIFTIFGCFVSILSFYEKSSYYLISVMAIVWFADSGAYFVGKYFGKTKLSPTISPGKTWEGAVGGYLIVFFLSVISTYIFEISDSFVSSIKDNVGWFIWFLCISLIILFSIFGDIFESFLKRLANVKDSGKFLPGHGGVLDRIDALIPVMPLALIFEKNLI